jgi:ABC-type proline/glycine betaine transport system substrate-binding protein
MVTYLPKKRGKYKKCRPGDHIHILVTKDFADTATEFFRICKDENFNPSEVIRSAMAEWVNRQQELKKLLRERNITKSDFMKQMAAAYEEDILYRK